MKIKFGITLFLAATVAVSTASFAQAERGDETATISGRVYEGSAGVPLEYANVVLYTAGDSAQVTGTITNPRGVFQLERVRTGSYFTAISFMGYRTYYSETLTITPAQEQIDLGRISLQPVALQIDDVVVEVERAPISYQIDKKVINVSQQQTAISGTAIEVLENVPSVTVDIEGNVSLRGSGNFTVLIDGRPSVLEPSEALQQIPASSIENIEIVTNPSARYDPEGTAGIINIVMKKNERRGRSATVNFNAGWDDKYGGDVLLQQKTERLHGTIGLDYRKRSYAGTDRNENHTSLGQSTTFVLANGASLRGRTALGLRGELQWNLSDRDVLSLGGRYRDRVSERGANLNYNEWSQPGSGNLLYTSLTERERSGNYYALFLNYQHAFYRQGHELYAELYFDRGESDEMTSNELRNSQQQITSGRRTTESGPGRELRAKLDYVHPLAGSRKFEAGFQSEIDHSEENTGLQEFDRDAGTYLMLPQFSNSTTYNRNLHAAYALFSGEWQKFGYQAGLRGEYTYRDIDFSGQRFTIDRWDYFPTLHASYEFSGGKQMMASYTRRIDRPRGWHLEPFETWMDAYNVRSGNPALEPEYIDSYEAGVQTYFGNSLLSAETYYRVNHNKIERVRSVYAENVTLHSMANVGTDYALGTELLFDFSLLRNWNVNLMGNLYQYRIKGELRGETFDRESFNWSARLNNNIKLARFTQLQINSRYNSPTVSSQGRREGFFVADVALRQDFLERQISATLQVRDLFGTAKYEYTSQGSDFYTYNYSTRESPIVMLNLRYNLNRPQNDRQRGDDGGGMDYGEEF